MNTTMNAELKKVMTRVKEAQEQLQSVLKDKTWIEEARKYAERQGKEVKKLLSSDVNKMREFLERERKGLEDLQKQIPGEVKKFRKFVSVQKKELEKALANMRSKKFAGSSKTNKAKKAPAKKAATSKATGAKKKTAAKKKASSAS